MVAHRRVVYVGFMMDQVAVDQVPLRVFTISSLNCHSIDAICHAEDGKRAADSEMREPLRHSIM